MTTAEGNLKIGLLELGNVSKALRLAQSDPGSTNGKGRAELRSGEMKGSRITVWLLESQSPQQLYLGNRLTL